MSILLAFAGKNGIGKDTAAEMLTSMPRYGVEEVPLEEDFEHHKFSEPLKKGLMAMTGLTWAEVDGPGKDVPMDKLGGKTPRSLLETLGNEWAQGEMGGDVWTRHLDGKWSDAQRRGKNIVISDLRFEAQADWVRRVGGTVVHLWLDGGESKTPRPYVYNSGVRLRKEDKWILAGIGDIEGFHKDVMDLAESIVPISEVVSNWVDSVYPDRTLDSCLRKLALEELPEFSANPQDPLELADVAILVQDMANFTGTKDAERAMRTKIAINKRRDWRVDPTTGVMSHVKSSSPPVAGEAPVRKIVVTPVKGKIQDEWGGVIRRLAQEENSLNAMFTGCGAAPGLKKGGIESFSALRPGGEGAMSLGFTSKEVLSLNVVPRWSTVVMRKEQSVAEHSYNVAQLAVAMATRVNRGRVGLDAPCDVAEATKWALNHDLPEVLTGDIPSPFKDCAGPALAEAEKLLFPEYAKGMEHAKSGMAYLIVATADLIDAWQFAKEHCIDRRRGEVLRGLEKGLRKVVRQMMDQWDVSDYISVVTEVWPDLKTRLKNA